MLERHRPATLLAVSLVVGCGRIGFETLADGTGVGAAGGSGVAGSAGAGGVAGSGVGGATSGGTGGGTSVGATGASFGEVDAGSSAGASAGGTAGAAGSSAGAGGAVGGSTAGSDGGPTGDSGAAVCDPPCTNTNGTTSCVAGACVPTCDPGFDDCDGSLENGCETDVASDDANCGVCGNVCGASTRCYAENCEGPCAVTGTWALRLTIRTSWQATSGLVAGTGDFVLWARADVAGASTPFSATMIPCGFVAPDRELIANGALIGSTYPSGTFDAEPAGLSPATSAVALSDVYPGSSVDLSAMAFLLGASLPDPINDAWPSNNISVTTVDVEPDGNPGITAPYKTGGNYVLPSVNATGSPLTDVVYWAHRIGFSASGALTSCSDITGVAAVQHLDDHVVGCQVVGGATCTPPEANYLDTLRRLPTVDGAILSMTEVASSATCADVRAALP